MEQITILEASKRIGVTKQAIYKKLRENKNEELQDQIQQTDKGKTITLKGLDILKGIFKEHIDKRTEAKSDNKPIENELLIKSLENQIEALKHQLETSNRLLENQQKITSQLLLASGNGENAEQENAKKGFWQRIFNK